MKLSKMDNKLILNLPPHINIIILKQKNNTSDAYIFNKNHFICFNLMTDKNIFIFDKESNSFSVLKLIPNKNLTYIINHLNKFLKSLDIYFFFKIKFKGKGYRIRFFKKNKIVKFYFGRSHITLFFFKKIILKKINKYKFLIKSLNDAKLKNTAININKIKPINVYTLRGLRISRQKIFKRKGKKGSYI